MDDLRRRTSCSRRQMMARLTGSALGLAAVGMLAPLRAAEEAISKRPPMITPETEKAVEKANTFLAQTQSKDGSWRARSGYGTYPTAMTALAGLGLMAGGNTPVEGKYSLNVRRAVDFIVLQGEKNASTGLIASPNEEMRPMYGHGFSMLFLGEAYGMERDPDRQEKIRKVLDKAVTLTGKSQSGPGGWLYTPDSGGDEGSVTVTQIQGLRSIRNAGIKVPKEIIDKACKYIENSANPDGGIRYRAGQGGASRPPITAAAVAVMYNAGKYENPVAEKSLDYLKKLIKGGGAANVFGGHNFYATLYCAQAMYLSSDENWKAYFPAVRDHLIRSQGQDGSWMGDGVGETYGSAIALIVLQLPYGHLPILQR
ncbi:MAG: prenyltransferase/squalene oxidase repeat-containing protein [Phycisphaeraceae bacterium]